MAKLCNAAPAFSAQPGGTGQNFTQPIVTHRLQSLLCCPARASFRLKSVIVVGAEQVLTGPSPVRGSCLGSSSEGLSSFLSQLFHQGIGGSDPCGAGCRGNPNQSVLGR